jgi:hypothetical protein
VHIKDLARPWSRIATTTPSPLWQRLADLYLAITSVEPAVQVEDLP